MAVYLGAYGRLTLRRKTSNGIKESVVNSSDVNVGKKRFSFDFDTGFLISGDQVEITSTNNTTLNFVSSSGWSNGVKQSSGKWFIHVDELGGVRLYTTFGDALAGGTASAIALDAIATDIPIKIIVANASNRILGAITNYELNTNRETVDTTALSDQFRSQWSSLMSGSGRIDCHWDYKDSYGGGTYETANYLLQLVLRTEVGSEFSAQLFLKTGGYAPSYAAEDVDDQIYYEINGVLTASALAFTPDNIVTMAADFVTTGPIRLLAKTASDFRVLQESADGILLEQDVTASLLQEADG